MFELEYYLNANKISFAIANDILLLNNHRISYDNNFNVETTHYIYKNLTLEEIIYVINSEIF